MNATARRDPVQLCCHPHLPISAATPGGQGQPDRAEHREPQSGALDRPAARSYPSRPPAHLPSPTTTPTDPCPTTKLAARNTARSRQKTLRHRSPTNEVKGIPNQRVAQHPSSQTPPKSPALPPNASNRPPRHASIDKARRATGRHPQGPPSRSLPEHPRPWRGAPTSAPAPTRSLLGPPSRAPELPPLSGQRRGVSVIRFGEDCVIEATRVVQATHVVERDRLP